MGWFDDIFRSVGGGHIANAAISPLEQEVYTGTFGAVDLSGLEVQDGENIGGWASRQLKGLGAAAAAFARGNKSKPLTDQPFVEGYAKSEISTYFIIALLGVVVVFIIKKIVSA